MAIITILSQAPTERIKKSNHTLLQKICSLFYANKVRGPGSVLRSIINGLEETGLTYNHNPHDPKEFADTVYVPGGIDVLRYALEQKKRGYIKTLLAGPNVVNHANEYDGIISSKDIDAYLVASNWFKNFLIHDNPSLENKVHVFPAGINTTQWQPSPTKRLSKKILVYQKNAPIELYKTICSTIRKYGFKAIQLPYGSFSQATFKKRLQQSFCAVFLSKRETQGIAFLESWSMDVPTLVWDYKPLADNNITPASSCPYLSEKTGIFWQNISEFERVLSHMIINQTAYAPRKWVLENMTDIICVKKLCKIIHIPTIFSMKKF